MLVGPKRLIFAFVPTMRFLKVTTLILNDVFSIHRGVNSAEGKI
jgi:hypothetical protein